MIKALIFDFGGVFDNGNGFSGFKDRYAGKFDLTPEEFRSVLMKFWRPARLSEISCQEFWDGIVGDLGCKPEYIKSLLREYVVYNKEMVEFVRSLKGRYKLAILSNHISDWFESSIGELGLEDVFDVIVTSYEVGMAKPDKKIYVETARRLCVKPEECVFIDDQENNIPPAEELGMKAILFRDNGQLKKELRELGIKTKS